jgi:hypothetical protein
MRYLIFCIAFLILPQFVLARDNDHHHSLSGYWYNKTSLVSIKVKEKKDGLMVIGLEGFRGTWIFDRIDSRCFIDRRGNRFILDQFDVLLFMPIKCKQTRITAFEKIEDAMYDHCKTDRFYGDREELQDNGNRHSGSLNERSTDYKSAKDDIKNWPDYATTINGTWLPDKGNKSVVMVDTREGLRAKFTGTSHWVDYTQSTLIPYEFIDIAGNKYTFDRAGNATWVPNERTKGMVHLKKVSDDPQF